MNWRYFAHGNKDYRVGKQLKTKQSMFFWGARLEILVGRSYVVFASGKWDGDLITEMKRISVDGEQAAAPVPQPLVDAATAALHYSPPRPVTIDLVVGSRDRLDELTALLKVRRARNRSEFIRELIDREIAAARTKGEIP